MKQSFFTLFVLTVLAMFFSTGCTNKSGSAEDSTGLDSLRKDSLPQDSLSQIVEQEEMPVAADELFDDFFFNFAASRKVQKERVTFPLPSDNMGKCTMIEKVGWKHESFFMKQGYYTLIFNTKKQAHLMKDTSVSQVRVECIASQRKRVSQWFFARHRGQWKLDSLRVIPISKHNDASFLVFYQRFAADTAFQHRSLAEQISFTGPDPDDDFSTMTGDILPEQWADFAPWLPSGTLYNIVYGAAPYPASNQRFFYVRGIANGLQIDLTFARRGKSWVLKKVNT